MSKGTIALIGGLVVVSLLVVLAVSLLVAVSGTLAEHEATREIDLIELIWLSVLRTLDPGTMGGDVGTVPFVLAMLTVTLGGIFIISTLIGIIASGIEGKLADLRKGRSRVIESGHTVILGWSAQIFSVIGQLAAPNSQGPGHRVVVLAERDKVEMEDEIRARLPQLGRTRVVCRSGRPIDLDELDISSPQTSRSIIVLSPVHDNPDAEVIKTLLALTNAPNRRPEPYHIVAELHDAHNLEVARLASQGEAQLVLVGDLIGRIAAQACRQPGLSVVYTDLLDFGGDEIYFSAHLGLAGLSFGEALSASRNSCLVGIATLGAARKGAGHPAPFLRRRMKLQAGATRGGTGGHGLALVPTLGDLLHHLAAEGVEVVRPAAGHQTMIDMNLFVDPLTAGIANVRLQAGIGSERAPTNDVSLHQQPGRVADCRHRLVLLEEPAREVDRVPVHAQKVGILDAARNDKAVVRVRSHVGYGAIDAERVALIHPVDPLDLTALDRDQLDLGAGLAGSLPRSLQFDLLDAVGGDESDLLASQLVPHLMYLQVTVYAAMASTIKRRLWGFARPG
ncbi:hypothetical protein BH24CHL6_BH24CHL6_06580 [soil metagenome]